MKISLILASVLCAFLIAEASLRFVLDAWPFHERVPTYPHLTAEDAPLRWRFSPSKNRNSLGLRNGEVGEKQTRQFRILYLGDSLVWSGKTSSGALYTRIIENNLNKELGSADTEFEVINAGIPGYTTFQELEFLKIYGLEMEPDLVILGFVFNDVFYKYLHKPDEKNMLGAEPKARLHRFNTRDFPGKLFARSHLAHTVFNGLESLAKTVAGHPRFPFEHRGDFYLAWKEYGWNETETLLGEMHELLRKRNMRLIVVIYPVMDQVDNRYLAIDRDYVLYPQKRIKGICDNNKIPFVDLTNELLRAGGTALFKDYLHLNDKGNDIVADEVTRYLIEMRLAWFNDAANARTRE